MKTISLIILLFLSNLSLASEQIEIQLKGFNDVRYVGCKTVNSKEAFEVIFKLYKNRIFSYRVIEDSFKSEVQLDRTLHKSNQLRIKYDSAYDTNFGILVDQTKELTSTGAILSWTSGNDSDNYYPEFNGDLAYCFDI